MPAEASESEGTVSSVVEAASAEVAIATVEVPEVAPALEAPDEATALQAPDEATASEAPNVATATVTLGQGQA